MSMRPLNAAANIRPLLTWVFCKGNDLLICRVEQLAGSKYVVALTAPTRNSFSLREPVIGVATAIQRHAAVASELREAGWALVGYREPQLPKRQRVRVPQAA